MLPEEVSAVQIREEKNRIEDAAKSIEDCFHSIEERDGIIEAVKQIIWTTGNGEKLKKEVVNTAEQLYSELDKLIQINRLISKNEIEVSQSDRTQLVSNLVRW